jgi:ferric-dicitrate binding protein FerR (iron transport regulator)
MNDREIEELIRGFDGPEPRPETRAAVMDAARGVRRRRKPAATVEPVSLAPRRRRRRWPPAVAAAVLLLAAGVCWSLTCPCPSPLGKALQGGLRAKRGGCGIALPAGAPLLAGDRLSAPRGGRFELADGSAVRLDTGTEVVLDRPRESQRARLLLKKGRILVRASRAPGEFVVAGSARVSVLGTVFGVTELAGSTRVGVLRGRVALASAGGRLELARGQAAGAAAGAVPALSDEDPDAMLGWARAGRSFRDRPLSEVLDWISDNSSYRFEVGDVRRIERNVSATVSTEPVRDLIERILTGCGIEYAITGRNVKIR